MTTYEQRVSRTTEEKFGDIVETYTDPAYNIAFRMLHNAMVAPRLIVAYEIGELDCNRYMICSDGA